MSALIGNNNSGASPHWNLIVPEAISRIDFQTVPITEDLGISIGGELLVTTKMPDKFEADLKQTVSVQPNQYGTKNTYADSVTSAYVGNRNGALSWFAAINFLDGFQQPLTYTTNGVIPAGTTGTYTALNKQGRSQIHRHRGAASHPAWHRRISRRPTILRIRSLQYRLHQGQRPESRLARVV